jgi:dual specificity tyrosine-phosphorylation-regulated kinase 2/3/4
MEVCGIPEAQMIKKSRKADYYFDEEFSPFLIEEDNVGILRIPASRTLQEASRCRDALFLDFVTKCLELDP